MNHNLEGACSQEQLEDEVERDSLKLCRFKAGCLWLYHSGQEARSGPRTTVPKGGKHQEL